MNCKLCSNPLALHIAEIHGEGIATRSIIHWEAPQYPDARVLSCFCTQCGIQYQDNRADDTGVGLMALANRVLSSDSEGNVEAPQ